MWSAILLLWTTWGKCKEQLEASTHIDVTFWYGGCSFMSIKCFFQYYYFCTHQIHTFYLFSPYVCRGTGAVLSWRLTSCMYSHPVKEQYVLLWPVLMKRPKSFLNICLYESMFGDAIPFFSANFILESMLIEFQTSLDQKQ